MNEQSSKSDPVGTSSPMSAPMSSRAFTEWGVHNVAYIKPVDFEDKTVYAIFAANGRQLGLADTLNVARAVVVQNDLEPVNVH